MLSKGQVVYEGISSHILTYDRKNLMNLVFYIFLLNEGLVNPMVPPERRSCICHMQVHLLRTLKTKAEVWVSLGKF